MSLLAKALNGEPIIGRAVNRIEVQLSRHVARRRATQLQHANETASESVLGEAPATVSLTTYGARFSLVHQTIESIASGAVRPRRLVLWLDDEDLLENPTPGLQRLADRGLEIRPAPALGPHKKYFPAVMEAAPGENELLVTADDDVIYPRYWLQELVESAGRNPGTVRCFRARRVVMRDGILQSYQQWRDCWGTTSSVHNVAIGGSGVAYPAVMIHALRAAGRGFLECAPSADDIWLHRIAVEAGIPVGQVRRRPRHFPTVPGSQSVSLVSVNVDGGGNDRQIRATYTPRAVQILASSLENAQR